MKPEKDKNRKKQEESETENDFLQLQEKLGLAGNMSPDQLREALKKLVSDKVIDDFKIKKDK